MPKTRTISRPVAILLCACAAASISTRAASAKNPEEPETAPRAGNDVTFLDHSGTEPYWLGLEANSISQYHPSFAAAYSTYPNPPYPQLPAACPAQDSNLNDCEQGHSLSPQSEAAISGLFTLFTAYRPFRTTDLIFDPEFALGNGLSGAAGVAGFPNLDVVRNPTLSHVPYIARAEVHQIIPLSDVWEPNEDRGPISSFAMVPRHRLELRAGKMSTADLFDINPAGSDSHMQFMNWTVDNNGAFDYAADTRGYTYGLVIEYQGPFVEARFGEMLMPKVANGIDLDWDIAKDRGENLELEIKYSRHPDWTGTLRVLGFVNHAAMGSYADAIAEAEGNGTTPNITLSRAKGRLKGGFGLNEIQNLGPLVRAFARIGWNDGRNESFAYTEVDNTFEVGGDLRGIPWRRPDDRVGLAFVSNGISTLHAEYLRLGGVGFLLGDGNLDYARETIVEHYYNFHVWRGAFLAEDVQVIADPGYNAARGPVWVFSLRGHLEF
jgi:high affinity Mn2+ porin